MRQLSDTEAVTLAVWASATMEKRLAGSVFPMLVELGLAERTPKRWVLNTTRAHKLGDEALRLAGLNVHLGDTANEKDASATGS